MKRNLLIMALAVSAISVRADGNISLSAAETADNNHATMFMRKADVANIRAAISSTPGIALQHKFTIGYCDRLLNIEPVTYVLDNMATPRLTTADEAEHRIINLAYAYRMTLDKRYADRAIKEMLAVCSFKDWNPGHFLDCATISAGVALGYDWLYDVIPEDSHKIILEKIYNYGLKAGETYETVKNCGFKRNNNWNSVCNAGMVIAALCVRNEYPTAATHALQRARDTNPALLKMMAPGGCYIEGPSYWVYGNNWEVVMIEAMKEVLGNDYGLSEYPGFKESARWMNFMTAPSGKSFNFSDSGTARDASELCSVWFAANANDPSLFYLDNILMNELAGKDNPADIFSYQFRPVFISLASRMDLSVPCPPQETFWENSASADNQPMFVYRGGWTRSDDAYLAMKGGKANSSHGHMDAGSFIYENNGIRWSIDLGMQDYTKFPGNQWDYTQNGDRWNIYRYSNINHNTLILNNKQHSVSGKATILETYRTNEKKGAKIDMRNPLNLGKLVINCARSIYLDENNDLHVDDEINPYVNNLKVQWIMMTEATPAVSGNVIYLEQEGKTKVMTLPEGVTPYAEKYTTPNEWDIAPAVPTYRVGYTMTITEANKPTTYSVTIKDKDSSGITEITESAEGIEGEEEYFNLQGIRIEKPEKGIVIRRYNGKTEKILIK